MRMDRELVWTTWSPVSSGFRGIELRGVRLESVGTLPHFLPQRTRRQQAAYVPASPLCEASS